jgi:hypothetical protein
LNFSAGYYAGVELIREDKFQAWFCRGTLAAQEVKKQNVSSRQKIRSRLDVITLSVLSLARQMKKSCSFFIRKQLAQF